MIEKAPFRQTPEFLHGVSGVVLRSFNALAEHRSFEWKTLDLAMGEDVHMAGPRRAVVTRADTLTSLHH